MPVIEAQRASILVPTITGISGQMRTYAWEAAMASPGLLVARNGRGSLQLMPARLAGQLDDGAKTEYPR
jgi:hypothetical protein